MDVARTLAARVVGRRVVSPAPSPRSARPRPVRRLGAHAWSRNDHLHDLLATTDRLADDVRRAVEAGSTAPDLWDRAVIASCRLDGSAHDETPSDGDTTALVGDDPDPADVWRREYAGVRRALGADDLAGLLRRDVLGGIQGLHRLLTQGLVAAHLRGRLRRTDQAVHTGGEGRLVFRPVTPDRLAREVARLPVLLADDPGVRDHPLEVAGVLQFELLRLHPFESANGRLARTAARLVLRGADRDPGGLAVPEIPMARRRSGNYDEVAAALRSGDLTRFLEGWGEDVTAGLRLAATRLGVQRAPVDDDLLADLPTTFTLVDLADRRDGGRAAARQAASDLQDAGWAERVHGSRGLRFRRRPGPVSA